MSLEIGLTLLAIIVLLALSAFFNGSETALTAASKARMHALVGEGNRRAGLVNRILASPEKMIGSVLLGNTLVDVLAAALAANLATALVGEVGVIYATMVMTMLIVIFSAVLPKTYALAEPEKVALGVSPFMRAVIWLLAPFNMALQIVVRALLRLTPSLKDDKANILAAREEIRGTIELQQKEGTVQRGDAEMLGGVLDLHELSVADIMVHRTKMTTVNILDPVAAVVSQVLESQFTRVPLWRDTPENIVGILHAKDLLAALSKNGFDAAALDIAAIAQPPWFVPDTTGVKEQLNAFLRRKLQMALVVDEYGEVQGLITLEDILEEIVGQIADEHDTADTMIRPQVDGSVNVDGTCTIRDINRQMGWELPDDEATTVAGLVIHEAQTIPEPGQAFTFHNYRFEILRKSRNKLTSLRIRPLDPALLATRRKSARTAAARQKAAETDAMDGG